VVEHGNSDLLQNRFFFVEKELINLCYYIDLQNLRVEPYAGINITIDCAK
jgi:hypothetical protein